MRFAPTNARPDMQNNGQAAMKRRMFVLILATVAFPAAAEDLVQIYRDALVGDPTLAAARATYNATQEVLPQARSGLLPVLSVLGNANKQDFRENLHSDPSTTFTQRFPQYFYTLSASQPLFRMQNWISFDQAKQQIGQSEYVLASAQQDLIVRVAQAYFDVLLAQFTIELTESQKAAVSENLAQAQRNFEVGVATITDTNDAQAKYDQVAAQEISVQNDLDNKIAALRAIIGRTPNQLKRVERSFEPEVPAPNAIEPWIDKALNENYQVRIAQSNFDIAALEVDRQRAGHYPTLDLVATYNQTYAGAAASTNLAANFASDLRQGQVGVQLNVPLYQGGLVNSRVRQAIANQDAARQNLEQARRAAQLLAQTSFTGVTSGVAQVKALTQAVKSAQVSYDSTKLGLEVGVRTNLDVLNQQQQVYQTRFNLAQSYYAYIINALKLKQAAGTLSDQDVEKINRDLGG
jgi:outer membrane protein